MTMRKISELRKKLRKTRTTVTGIIEENNAREGMDPHDREEAVIDIKRKTGMELSDFETRKFFPLSSYYYKKIGEEYQRFGKKQIETLASYLVRRNLVYGE